MRLRSTSEASAHAVAMLLAVLAGCAAPRPATRLSGSFSGQTGEGQPVLVTFSEDDDQAFRGEGAIGQDAIILAGVAGWRGTASLVRAGGRQAVVELKLSSDGERLVLESEGSAPLVLVRGGTPVITADGPLSGRYRAHKDGGKLADVSLVQRGSLLAGVAIVGGEPAGVSGQVAAANAARGVLTFLDGSQVPFTLESSADGKSLRVNAFGQDLTLDRVGP
jgi:hypothetical protein